jgi:phospholipase C
MAVFRRAASLMMATALTVAQPGFVRSAMAQPAPGQAPLVTAQPSPGPAVAPFVSDLSAESAVSRDALIRQLRQKVKYVFVVFNENHSFDNEYGTFPGADGLYADANGPRDAAHTPGFTQTYKDAAGKTYTATPFRLGPNENATFRDSVDHSHVGLAHKLDVVNGTPKMDGFAQADFDRVAAHGGAAQEKMGHQFAHLVMSHFDCDTIPLFWNYANRFALFDKIFATEDTPSTPNAIAMIAGQAGETQWVKHGSTPREVAVGNHKGKLQAVPLVNDPQPFWGSQYDTTPAAQKQPDSPSESYADGNIAGNLTFANVAVTLAGRDIDAMMKQDRSPETDLADIQQDIPFVAARNGTPVAWRWYQEGYDHEPYETGTEASHKGYVSHHQGPQYFGYVANNPAFKGNLRGMGDFFTDMKQGDVPVDGGVFYIRGGFTNVQIMLPPIQNANFPAPLTDADRAAINKTKQGDDDHPGYTDSMISEAMAAHVVNEVASRPDIWSQSAIIITYDESDGFYDHVPPRILSYGPDGLPLARGVRIPLILISPYARAHVVSHAEGDHNAVIETLSAIYDLPPLASLPEEKAALLAGEDPQFNGPNGFVQHHLGPRDINAPETDDLLSGFDPARLAGTKPPLPASYAMIDESVVDTLPHYAGKGCAAIGMTPVPPPAGVSDAPPAHLNTLPSTLPAYN